MLLLPADAWPANREICSDRFESLGMRRRLGNGRQLIDTQRAV